MNRALLLNALLFQAGWLACIYAATQPLLLGVAALMLLAHFLPRGRWQAEGRLVASVLIAGSALDSLLLQMGVFDFGEPRTLIPAWLALLWALLGTTLNHCLAWSAKPWWLSSLLGALGGPLAYWSGAQLAGVGMPLGETVTLTLLALLWALLMPVLHGFAALYRARAALAG
ncbi:DUF2878 domain-containing protein [Pseudomonas sp. NW5]|uniref:DUF2878 domain-containing protein n=1 Tax=Pseudomonas sp. NW5 TaxID=2934934 RepID=UPI002022352B|nr:DUF2878 domain-containing protein [Pseudomonas sp. NW5]MCL7461755.1 DUF2878 domain-containing protein [Pseudomonas sp. NW5]